MGPQPGTEALATGTPSVPLPPAALRLESLDFDLVGNPYYKFPPFLGPPEGVTLIPFHKFKPHGIQIALDSDQEELDGEGIPTVELGAKHNIEEKDRDTKRRKKKSKKDNDGPRKSSPWWDDWAEGEDLRTATVFDPNTPRTERFSAGASEFAQGRKFTPSLQSLYDHFRHFSGLLASPKVNKYGQGSDGDKQDDDDEDEEDDEEELHAEGVAAAQEGESKPLLDVGKYGSESHIEEVDEEIDFRMDAFLNDPETSIKILFSSFYKDKGLAWSESKLRDGPILLSFFLAFFVRNRIMPDYGRAFIKAHRVAEQARLELPQTAKISMCLPDVFGRACTALWGVKKPDGWTDTDYMDVDAPVPNPTIPDPAPMPVSEAAPKATAKPVDEWETQLQERGLESIDDDLSPTPNGWGEPSTHEAVVGGWGDGMTVITDDSANPWNLPAKVDDWNAGEPAPSLLQVLGPTALPLTHTVQRVEKATRQIVAFFPPRADAIGLERILGTVVLAPWTKYWKETPISRPQMLVDDGAAGAFDPGRDLIRVFVDPEVVDVLREGMGLHGLFVQAVQSVETDAPKQTKSKSRGKARGKAKGVTDREWWYVEFLYEVLPSFWTEEGDLE